MNGSNVQIRSWLKAVTCLGLTALMLAACSPRRAHVVVDTAQPRQQIIGWEVTPRLGEFDKEANRYDPQWLSARQSILNVLVNEAGINRVRIEVRSGVENPVDYWSQFVAGKISYDEVKSHFYEKINDDADPNHVNPQGFQWSSFDYYVEEFVLPMQALVKARGEKLYINLCYVDFKWTDKKGSLSHAGSPDEYAELVAAAADRLTQRYGLTLDAVEIILEPDNSDAWNGQAIGKAINATQRRLASIGLYPQIIAPSPAHAWKTLQLLDGIRSIEEAQSKVGMISYHRYDKSLADLALPFVRGRAKTLGVATGMLEYVDGSTTTFFNDMAAGGASAWQLYGAARPAGRDRPGYIAEFDDYHQARLTDQMAQIAAVQRNVRAGAHSLPARVQGGNRVLAFRNPDGSEVVAIFGRRSTEFKVAGLSPGTYRVETIAENGASNVTNITSDHVHAVHVTMSKGSVAVLTRAPTSS
jgi:hypothetical protein